MKTTLIMPAVEKNTLARGKNYLKTGFISLTSKNFVIFASVMAAALIYIGLLSGDVAWTYRLTGYGAAVFIAGNAPRALRQFLKGSADKRHLETNNDKW